MEISTKIRYGARALAELGRAYPERPVPARELAELQDLSVKYLEHILSALKASGILRSERGMSGGYQLARSPDKISLKEAFNALEGSTAPIKCVEDPESCSRSGDCPTLPTWVQLKEAIDGVLEPTTVADLAERISSGSEEQKPTYHI